MKYVVRGMPSTAGGIVVKSETAESKESPYQTLNETLGGTQLCNKFAQEATVWGMWTKALSVQLWYQLSKN